MYYLLISFKYKIIETYRDDEIECDTLLYFYNTYKECELKYEQIKKDLVKTYNGTLKEAYKASGIVSTNCGSDWVELEEENIEYTIDIVELSK